MTSLFFGSPSIDNREIDRGGGVGDEVPLLRVESIERRETLRKGGVASIESREPGRA